QPIPAGRLTRDHYLTIPRRYAFGTLDAVYVAEELNQVRVTYRVPWKLSQADREMIASATAQGESSRRIGALLGKSASYVRHVRSKIAHGRAQDARTRGLLLEGKALRFPGEHRPGIPRTIPLDAGFARLLGYYCAEGCVTKGKNRPNSRTLNFSFS